MGQNDHGFRLSYLIVSIALIFVASAARADVTGSISGVVHDRAQAVVTGVQIRVTNIQTNLSHETTSASDGSYHFLALPAGTYTLTVNASGFRPYTATDITLQVNDQLRIEITLQVGTVKEEVNVAADAAHVETESTQLGDVIDSKKMLALPLNGRSYIDLLGLQAGVAPATAGTIGGDRPISGNLNAGNISVNGQRETANAFLVNGGDVSEGRNLGAGLVPNLDSVEEFRLITNSFDAEYGKFSGAVMNAITKTGTNGFHGDVFEFLRNDKMDATTYGFGLNPAKSELRRNQFGYAVGGPFWKDKLFWFTDYQGTRQVAGAETGSITLPTVLERQGNFGPGPLTGAVDGPYWAQVLSKRLGYPVNFPEPYWIAGCNTLTQAQAGMCVFPGGVIPQKAWSPAAIGTLQYIPAPTNPATGAYSNSSQRDRVTDNKIGERVDFNNRKTGTWSFYYHFDDSTVNSALPLLEEAGTNEPTGFPSVTSSRAQQFVISDTKTLGPTAVNEARFSFFRTALHKDTPTGNFAQLSSLGFVTGAGSLGIIPDGTPGYPQFLPPLTFSSFSVGFPALNTFQPDNTYMVTDGFSKVVGRHTLKFGGEFRYLQVNERNLANVNGGFSFNGSVTGVDFADYLLGATAPQAGYTQAALQLLDSRTRYGGAYGQDTWKATPNLTLNLGLRWEVSMPWYDTQGKIQTFVLGQQSVVFPGAPKGLVFPGDPGVPKTLAPTRYNNFGPRLGLAYSPDFSDGVLGKIFGGPGKTSIRASYGIYYTSVEDLNLFFEVADAPFGLYWQPPSPVLFEEPFLNRQTGTSIGQRFPFTLPTPGSPANKTLSFAVYEPISASPGYDNRARLPYAEHFNISIQRELTRSTVLTLAYVGTEGHRLITQMEANPGSAALCMQLNAEGATPACAPNGEQVDYTVGTSTVYGTRNTLLNPNFCPGTPSPSLCFGSGNTFTKLIANSVYNSGEVTVERKAGDLTLLAAYTFAKSLDNSSAFGDMANFTNPALSRGLSSTDVHHNFVASYVWAIPFNRAFPGGPRRLTQGWQVQGITRLATGFPIQMQQAGPVSTGPLCPVGPCLGDTSLAGSSSTDMPDLVGPVHTMNPRTSAARTGSYSYFNQSAFAATSCNLVGNVLTGECGTFGTANRRFFHGPGFNNTDLGLTKRIPVTEAMAFEIRGEFFNIFNHAQFTNPTGNISSGNFGKVTGARPARIGQVSAKFIW